MRYPFRKLMLGFASLPLLVGAVAYAFRWLAVDSCLDRGGVYDYATHLCRFDVQFSQAEPLISPYVLVACVLLSLGVAVAALLGGRAHAP